MHKCACSWITFQHDCTECPNMCRFFFGDVHVSRASVTISYKCIVEISRGEGSPSQSLQMMKIACVCLEYHNRLNRCETCIVSTCTRKLNLMILLRYYTVTNVHLLLYPCAPCIPYPIYSYGTRYRITITRFHASSVAQYDTRLDRVRGSIFRKLFVLLAGRGSRCCRPGSNSSHLVPSSPLLHHSTVELGQSKYKSGEMREWAKICLYMLSSEAAWPQHSQTA